MTRHRPLLVQARIVRIALALVLAGLFVAACQASQPAASQPAASHPAATGVRRPTREEAIKLVMAVGTYEQAAQLEAALQVWRERDRIRWAVRHWKHFQGLVHALANRAARLEFVAFVDAHRASATGFVGAPGGGGLFAAPRTVPTTVFQVAAPNQCAFTLPGQEPLSKPALRWLRTGDAIEEEDPPIRLQLIEWADADTSPVPMTAEEIAAYEQWRSENTAPIPMTDEEAAWAAEQRAASGAPYPMDDGEMAAVEAAAAEAPPFTDQLLDWINAYDQDSAPVPMTPEEAAWADQERADSGAPYPYVDPAEPVPMTDEEAAWADQQRSDSGAPYPYVDPAEPVPMTPEEAAWTAQQRADSGAPYPMDDGTVDAYGQWIEDGAPVPMTDAEIQQYGQWVDDGAPIPMTPEESAWADQQRADSGAPYPWVDPSEPIPMTPEEVAWAEQQRAESTAPVPMTPEEIAAVEAAARNRTLNISDEDWDWILEHNGMGSGSPAGPPAAPCAWFIDHGFTNPVGASGHIKGQKCGDPPGQWIVNGTYEMTTSGYKFVGTQQWTIQIGSNGTDGTYSYETTVTGPMAIVKGTASGTVTLTIQADGSAHMAFHELTHSYVAPNGRDTAPPGIVGSFDWQVGGTC